MPPVRRRHSALINRLTGDGTGRPQAAILDELRRALLDGQVPPGTPIPVDEVAALFGVSHIPVRESLKTLIGEGLVEHRPNLGYTVAMLTATELHEMYLVREVLESAARTAAVRAATQADDAEASSAHQALDAAMRAHDVRGYHQDSRRFHWALVRPCGTARRVPCQGHSGAAARQPQAPPPVARDPARPASAHRPVRRDATRTLTLVEAAKYMFQVTAL